MTLVKSKGERINISAVLHSDSESKGFVRPLVKTGVYKYAKINNPDLFRAIATQNELLASNPLFFHPISLELV